jgi:cytochrome c peroxidase
MVNAFRDAMAKLAVVGQDTSNMTDCSAMIPIPQPLPGVNHRSD